MSIFEHQLWWITYVRILTCVVYSTAQHVSTQVCAHNGLMLLIVSSLSCGIKHSPKPRLDCCVRGVVHSDAATYALYHAASGPTTQSLHEEYRGVRHTVQTRLPFH